MMDIAAEKSSLFFQYIILIFISWSETIILKAFFWIGNYLQLEILSEI